MSLAKRNSEAAKAWAAKRRESKERALLQERGSSASRRPSSSCQETEQPPKHSASTSHEVNAEYMEDFRAGMAKMYLALEGPTGGGREDDDDELVRRAQQDRSYLDSSSEAAAGRRSAKRNSSSRKPYQGEKSVYARRRRSECTGKRGGRIETAPEMILLANERVKDTSGGAVAGWYRGPLDPAGQLLDLSDRNLLCASVLGDEAVFGCADHSLYCVDLSRGTKTRQLYATRPNRDAGHKEWVSAVVHTALGDIASGGMDGKLCLWPRRGGNPREVQAHAGSISSMKADTEGRVVTSGYGGALRVWDCRGGSSGGSSGWGGTLPLSGELSDPLLPAPCMEFAWCGSHVLTGHRDGRLGVFDLETGALVNGGCAGEQAHRGHVTTVNTLVNGGSSGAGSGETTTATTTGCFVTGGQDGFIRIWDPRVGALVANSLPRSSGVGGAAVMEAPAHRGPAGVGAVGGVMAVGTGLNRLASFGADKRICILEMRGGRMGGSSNCHGGAASSSSVRNGHTDSWGVSSSLVIDHVFDSHRDYIYCMDFIPADTRTAATTGGRARGDGEGLLVTGGGDGVLLVHELGSRRLLYGLGCCSAGAVRCAVAGERRLTIGGDDGNAMLYQFDDTTHRG